MHNTVRDILFVFQLCLLLFLLAYVSNLFSNQSHTLVYSLMLPVISFAEPADPYVSIPETKLSTHWKRGAVEALARIDRYSAQIHEQATRELCCFDPLLLQAVVIAESHATDAPSHNFKGACGPAQITGKAVDELVKHHYIEPGLDFCAVEHNILIMTRYFWYLYYDAGIKDPLRLVIAYNEGPTGSKKFVRNPGGHKYLQRVAFAYRLLKKHA